MTMRQAGTTWALFTTFPTLGGGGGGPFPEVLHHSHYNKLLPCMMGCVIRKVSSDPVQYHLMFVQVFRILICLLNGFGCLVPN